MFARGVFGTRLGLRGDRPTYEPAGDLENGA